MENRRPDGDPGAPMRPRTEARPSASSGTVSHRTFTLVRRGYDPAEVRAYLEKVGENLDALARRDEELTRREQRLESEIRELQARQGVVLDESYLTEKLGQETSKILQAAHRAAGEARARAEDMAREIVREAEEAARALVTAADSDAAERVRASEEASAQILEKAGEEAAALVGRGSEQARQAVDQARTEGREIYRQVKALRTEMLRDLAKRRKALTAQVEELRAGREVLARSLASLQSEVNASAERYARVEQETRAAATAAVGRAQAMDEFAGLPADESGGDATATDVDGARTPPAEGPLPGPDDSAVGSEAPVDVDLDPQASIDAVRAETARARQKLAVEHPSPAETASGAIGTGSASGELGASPAGSSTREGPAGAPFPVGTVGERAPGTEPVFVPSSAGDDPGAGSVLGTDVRATRSPAARAPESPETAEVPAVTPPARSPGLPVATPPPGSSTGVRTPAKRKGLMAVLFGGRRTEDEGVLPVGMKKIEQPPDADAVSSGVRVLDGGGTSAQDAPAESPGVLIPDDTGPPAQDAPPESPGGAGPDLFDKLRVDVEAEKRAYYGLESEPVCVDTDSVQMSPEDGDATRHDSAIGEAGSGAATDAGSARITEGGLDAGKAPGTDDEVEGTGGGDTDGGEDNWTFEEKLLHRRSGMLDPLVVELARKVKRVLQDEQNELMDKIRLEGPKPPAELLGPVDEQEYRYRRAAVETIVKASTSGGLFATGRQDVSVSLPDDLVGNFATAMTSWLRNRLAQRYEAAGIDTAASKQEAVTMATGVIIATYRECKGAYLDQIVRDHAVSSFSRGILEGLGRRAVLQWVFDDGGEPCSDCEDNVLAGPVRAWEDYPTGQQHPPAHSGCRCLIVPVSS